MKVQTRDRGREWKAVLWAGFGCLLALLLVCVLSSCEKTSGKTEPGVLNTPGNIRVEDDEMLYWDAVENAAGYVVEIDGKEYEATENNLDVFLKLILPKKYDIRIKAWSNLGAYEDSAWSEIIKYKPTVVEDLTFHKLGNKNEYEIGKNSDLTICGKLTIPSNAGEKNSPVTRISQSAFKNCTKLTSVILSDTITTIEAGAFSGCTNLKRIVLSKRLSCIQSGAFENCASLEMIVLPEALSEINNIAFSGCASLRKINIPSGVRKIGLSVFSRCENLQALTVDEENPVFRGEGNCIIRRSDEELVTGTASSVIPESVVSIGKMAFYECTGLTEITIPGSVKSIKQKAFSGCSDLKTVIFCEGVKNIGDPDSGISLEEYDIFSYCSALEGLHLPASVEYISTALGAFCDNLTALSVDPANAVFYSDGNCIIRRDTGELVAGCKTSIIPSGIRKIGQSAFLGCAFTEFTIPEGVEEIGRRAFYKSALLKVILPSTLKTIGNEAFGGEDTFLSPLREINLPDGLVTIGYSAFAYTKLEYVSIPASVQEIGSCAFYLTTELVAVLPGSVSVVGKLAFSGKNTVFTDVTRNTLPPGWYVGVDKATNEDNSWRAFYTIYGCKLEYENGIPYVNAISCFSEIDDTENAGRNFIQQICIPYRNGYTFVGFATTPGGEAVYLPTDGKVLKTEEWLALTPGTVLYAVWRAEE